MNECRMCGVVASSSKGGERKFADERLWHTDDFVVVPSVGALTEGHLLVVSRRHVLSSGHLDDREIAALGPVLDRVAHVVRREYGSAVIFEHGPSAPGQAVGCTVDHAHVHVLPFTEDLEALAKAAAPELSWQEVASITDVRRATASERPYLFMQPVAGRAFIAADSRIPSQFFRRVIASTTGQAQSHDWRIDSRLEVVSATLASLRGAFDSGEELWATRSRTLRRSA